MSKGLGFLQSNIQDMLQDGDTLTVADVMEVAGPDYDPRHIRRAFKSLHRRGKVCLTVKAGCLAVKVKSAPRSPAQGPVADALDASDTGAGQRGSAASRRLRRRGSYGCRAAFSGPYGCRSAFPGSYDARCRFPAGSNPRTTPSPLPGH
jgi:hypothetical protein